MIDHAAVVAPPPIVAPDNVMAEGVDLHLSCRHIIHHDLTPFI